MWFIVSFVLGFITCLIYKHNIKHNSDLDITLEYISYLSLINDTEKISLIKAKLEDQSVTMGTISKIRSQPSVLS